MDADDGDGKNGTWSLKGRLTWASPDFISLKVEAFAFARGNAHGTSWTQNINIDLRTGRPIVIGDLIPEAKLDGLTTTCLGQIRTRLAAA